MTITDYLLDVSAEPSIRISRISLGTAVVGLIPGLGYLALFVCGALGIVDWVGLLAGRCTSWLGPLAVCGLVMSTIVGASSKTGSQYRLWFRACVAVSVVLIVVDVPLTLVQLVSFFDHID